MGEEKGRRGTGVTGPGTELVPSPYTRPQGAGDGTNSVPWMLLGTVVLWLLSSCSSPDTGYFPTTPGHEWTYDISRTSTENQSPIIQKSIVRSLPATTVDGITYYPMMYANGTTHYFTRSTEGIVRSAPGREGADPVIVHPLRVGSEWSGASQLYLFDLPKKLEGAWERLSSNLELDYTITGMDEHVEAPAGYFSGCLRIDAIGFLDLPTRLMLGIRIIKVEQTQWYAPGVGLVKMTRREYAIPNLYPSEYTQVLTSFKRK